MGRVMHHQAATQIASNPFSTKFIRPGAIDFVVELAEGLPDIVARFERVGRRGQIVGPHGSGKSTLLWALRPLLEQHADVHWTQVQPATPFAKPQDVSPQCGKPVVWVIDGFDSLSWFVRRAIRGFSRREQVGLLITTHRDLKLPTLSRPFLTFATFRDLVKQLLADSSVDLDEFEIRQVYDRHSPNVREALFALYDAFERQRRG